MEQAGPAEEEMPETAAPEGEVMPSEETEDFSDPAGEGALEPEADVPEPDMEQAPDFWSDSLEVSSADAGMGTAEEAGYESVNSGEASRQELPQPVGTIPYRPEEDAAAPPVEQAPSRPGLMAG